MRLIIFFLIVAVALASIYFIFFAWQEPRSDLAQEEAKVRTQLIALEVSLDRMKGRPLMQGDRLLWKRLEEEIKTLNSMLSQYRMLRAEETTRRHYEDATWWADKVLRLMVVISILVAALSGLGFYTMTSLEQKTANLQSTATTVMQGAEALRKRAEQAINKTEAATAKIEKMTAALISEFERLDIDSVTRKGLFLLEPIKRVEELEYYDTQITAWEFYADIPAKVYLALGKYFFSRRDFARAIIRFNDALERDSELAEAHYFKGFSLVFQSRPLEEDARRQGLEEAGKHFQKALKLDNRRPDFYVGLGWWEDEMENYSEAIRRYDEALNIDPNFIIARYNKACAYSKAGDVQNARQILGQMEVTGDVRRWIQADLDRDLSAVKQAFPGFLEGLITPAAAGG